MTCRHCGSRELMRYLETDEDSGRWRWEYVCRCCGYVGTAAQAIAKNAICAGEETR